MVGEFRVVGMYILGPSGILVVTLLPGVNLYLSSPSLPFLPGSSVVLYARACGQVCTWVALPRGFGVCVFAWLLVLCASVFAFASVVLCFTFSRLSAEFSVGPVCRLVSPFSLSISPLAALPSIAHWALEGSSIDTHQSREFNWHIISVIVTDLT